MLSCENARFQTRISFNLQLIGQSTSLLILFDFPPVFVQWWLAWWYNLNALHPHTSRCLVCSALSFHHFRENRTTLTEIGIFFANECIYDSRLWFWQTNCDATFILGFLFIPNKCVRYWARHLYLPLVVWWFRVCIMKNIEIDRVSESGNFD